MTKVEDLGFIPDPQMPDRPAAKDVLTTVTQISFVSAEDSPVTLMLAYDKASEFKEEPYRRRLESIAGMEAINPIKDNWVKHIGKVLIINKSKRDKEDLDVGKIVVFFEKNEEDGMIVEPGDSWMGFPKRPDKLRVKSVAGVANVVVHVFPQ